MGTESSSYYRMASTVNHKLTIDPFTGNSEVYHMTARRYLITLHQSYHFSALKSALLYSCLSQVDWFTTAGIESILPILLYGKAF